MKVKVTQLYLTLCDPIDYAVHGILLARVLKWVAFPFSRGSSQSTDQTQVSHIAGRFFTSWATREAQRLKAKGEEGDRRLDGWMASPTQWTWIWVNFRSWWWAGKPGVLQSMGSQRIGHEWGTQLNWTESYEVANLHLSKPGLRARYVTISQVLYLQCLASWAWDTLSASNYLGCGTKNLYF